MFWSSYYMYFIGQLIKTSLNVVCSLLTHCRLTSLWNKFEYCPGIVDGYLGNCFALMKKKI